MASTPRESRSWLKCLLIFCLLCPAASSVRGQELLRNGDFEAGRLVPWEAKQVAGSSVVLTTESSPFHSVYPIGSASVHLQDDDSSDFLDQPSIGQQFSTGQEAILFGFDFKMPNPGDPSPWYVAWNGENNTTGFFFRLGGADGVSIEFNLQKIADLRSNVWYHIEGWADAPHQRIEGKVINDLGEQSFFQGGFPFGVKNELDGIVVSDGDAARNPEVLLDNFYSRPVTLEIALNAQGQVVITWLATTFTLESSLSLGADAPWTAVPTVNSTYTNTFTDRVRFFRLTH